MSQLDPALVHSANAFTQYWLGNRSTPPAAATGLGLWPLLAMLASGAQSDTLDELLQAIGIEEERSGKVAAELSEFCTAQESVEMALGLWKHKELTLNSAWLDTVPDNIIGTLTGKNDLDQKQLDEWANRHTKGQIPRFPLTVDEFAVLILASALSIETTWEIPFKDEPQPVASGPWSDLGLVNYVRADLPLDQLRITQSASALRVKGTDGVDVVLVVGQEDLMPQDVLSMACEAATVPNWGKPAATLNRKNSAPGVVVTRTDLPYPQNEWTVDANVVCFNVESDIDLLEDKEVLGMCSASDKNVANFRSLSFDELYIAQAQQKCRAEFSAKGFKAAAVTAVMMWMSGAPSFDGPLYRHLYVRFMLDRPFAYVAVHRDTGLILMAGWIEEPEVGENWS